MIRRLGLALVAALIVGGCGVQTDSAPRPLAGQSTTTGPNPTQGPTSSVIFLVKRDDGAAHLVEVERGLSGPAEPIAVLEVLLSGPSRDETNIGYSTFIPPGTNALSIDLNGDMVTLEMNEEWSTLSEPAATGAYAQVVYTLTAVSGIAKVRFIVQGQPIEAPTSNSTKEVVTREDYLPLQPI